MPKERKTADELIALVRQEISDDPACADIVFAIDKGEPDGTGWTVTTLHGETEMHPCRERTLQAAARLAERYDLAR